MERKHKIIVTDLDDTMIEQYGKVTEPLKILWNELSQRDDMTLIVATGQQYMKVREIFLSNGIIVPNYILADQGTTIFKPRENKILKRFYLKNEDVAKITTQFYNIGGKKEFVRIYTGETVVAYECKEAKEFFTNTKQRNVLYGKDIDSVIENGRYSKVILMDKTEVIDGLVLYALNNTNIIPMNTGKTSYGKCNFDRCEVVNADKKIALTSLMTLKFNFPEHSENNDYDIQMLALGDEQSDYSLAQFSMSMNLYPNSTGHFALIQNGSKGNEILKYSINELSTDLGLSKNILLSSSVKENGWAEAVQKWLELID